MLTKLNNSDNKNKMAGVAALAIEERKHKANSQKYTALEWVVKLYGRRRKEASDVFCHLASRRMTSSLQANVSGCYLNCMAGST